MEQFHKVGELGFIGLPYPKEYGGQGLGYMEYALAVEEVSKVDVSFGIAFSVTTSLYAGSVWNSDATEEQKNRRKLYFLSHTGLFRAFVQSIKSGIMKVTIMIAFTLSCRILFYR